MHMQREQLIEIYGCVILDILRIEIDVLKIQNLVMCQALEKLDTLYYTKNQLLLAIVKML
jgi:hypothetical protein